MTYENRDKFGELADEMEAKPKEFAAKEQPELYRRIINNLRGLEYDDFANVHYATPKLQMIEDFTALGRDDIVEQVKDGKFDQ